MKRILSSVGAWLLVAGAVFVLSALTAWVLLRRLGR